MSGDLAFEWIGGRVVPADEKTVSDTYPLICADTGSGLTVLEADNPWGTFSLVHYDWMWYRREACPYTPRIPQKWFSEEKLEGLAAALRALE